jgi:hypothetical protein
MMRQISLIPVSQAELNASAFHLAMLLQQVEEEESNWKEAKEAHQDTMAVLKKGIAEQRDVIRRAKQEAEEGLTKRQVEALLNQAKEEGEEER